LGVVVVAAGLAGVVDVGDEFVAGAVLFPMFDPEALTVPDAGVPPVGVDAGSVVIGVGSGGRGFERIPAIISLRPVSVWLWRYLYQVLKLSIHSFFAA
jgi:hypothetical protein